MKTSEQINEIASALCKAQREMTGAKKSAKNPFFRSMYSDLSMVMEAINIPFTNNGLSFVQAAESEGEMIAVTTRIMHVSGQWIESITCLPPTKNDAQSYGSAISYAKRYGLQALTGVPSVDDDGNAAATHQVPQKTTQSSTFDPNTLLKANNINALRQLFADAWRHASNKAEVKAAYEKRKQQLESS